MGFDLEKIYSPIQKEDLCIISGKVGGNLRGGMDSMDPSIETEGWLHLDLAVIALTTGHPSAPKDSIPHFQRASMKHVAHLSIDLNDLSCSLVARDHRKTNARISSFPHMHIRATNASSQNLNKDFSIFQFGKRESFHDQGLIKFLKDHRFGFHELNLPTSNITEMFGLYRQE
jgi:hypothetical protein